MLTHYRYVHPDNDGVNPVYVTVSTDDILREFYPHWKQQMLKIHSVAEFERMFDTQDCINDWISDHYAWEVEQP